MGKSAIYCGHIAEIIELDRPGGLVEGGNTENALEEGGKVGPCERGGTVESFRGQAVGTEVKEGC